MLSCLYSRKTNTKIVNNEATIKKEAEKDLKMSRYFVRGLIRSMNYNQLLANKCAKEATAESLAQVLQLSFNISNGQKQFQDLEQLKDLICKEMRTIPEKLKSKSVSDKVKEFINAHLN